MRKHWESNGTPLTFVLLLRKHQLRTNCEQNGEQGNRSPRVSQKAQDNGTI